MTRIYQFLLVIVTLILSAVSSFGQTVELNNIIQPTCTSDDIGEFEAELIGSSEPTVVFVLSAFPSGSPNYTQRDTTTLKTITYSNLTEGNYFVNAFDLLGAPIASNFLALDIDEPQITVPLVPVVVCSNDGPQDLLPLVSVDQPGGTYSFSGPGVSGNTFDPAGLSGFENITVTYDLGVCTVSNTMTFDIEPAPVIIPLPTTVCEDTTPFNLVPFVTANIPGGTFGFTGPGVAGKYLRSNRAKRAGAHRRSLCAWELYCN